MVRKRLEKLNQGFLEGRDPNQELLALVTEDGYNVDFGRLSHCFVDHAKELNPDISFYLSTKLIKIVKDGGYVQNNYQ